MRQCDNEIIVALLLIQDSLIEYRATSLFIILNQSGGNQAISIEAG